MCLPSQTFFAASQNMEINSINSFAEQCKNLINCVYELIQSFIIQSVHLALNIYHVVLPQQQFLQAIYVLFWFV
jgi:hypothetical protein